MTRLPANANEAVELLDLRLGKGVLAVAPDNGFVEALASAIGDDASVMVVNPPPETEVPSNAEVVDAIPDGFCAPNVIVWLGPVPSHTIRDYPAYVADKGTLWAVLPRFSRGETVTLHEADVKKALLVKGWRDDKTVALATDCYAIRFHHRR